MPTFTPLASDNFHQADGPLNASNWAVMAAFGSTLETLSNLCVPNSVGLYGANLYTGISSPNDQYSQVTFHTFGGGSEDDVFIRCDTNEATGYDAIVHFGGSFYSVRLFDVAASSFLGTYNLPGLPQPGDVLTLYALGTNIVVLYNGVQIISVTNSSTASGQTGLFMSASGSQAATSFSLFTTGSVSNTFSISGNAGVAGATVNLTGASSASTTADGSGNYSFSGLANGSYTITPSLSGYTFSPTSQNETISGSSITGVNFTATQVFTISGNAGAAGATVSYSGTASGSVTAAGDGSYSITGLSAGSYTITPSLTNYVFSPTSQNETITSSNITGVNFTATETGGPSLSINSGYPRRCQVFGRLSAGPNAGEIAAVAVDAYGNLLISGGSTTAPITSVDIISNDYAWPVMIYGSLPSTGEVVAVAVDSSGNLCCANVGTGGGNPSTVVDTVAAAMIQTTPIQIFGRAPNESLIAVPVTSLNALYDSVNPGTTPINTVDVAPNGSLTPILLCGRTPSGDIVAVSLDSAGRLCISGSGSSGSTNVVDVFDNGQCGMVTLFGRNPNTGTLQSVALDSNGNLLLS